MKRTISRYDLAFIGTMNRLLQRKLSDEATILEIEFEEEEGDNTVAKLRVKFGATHKIYLSFTGNINVAEEIPIGDWKLSYHDEDIILEVTHRNDEDAGWAKFKVGLGLR